LEKCVIVKGEDKLSKQANENATTLFQVSYFTLYEKVLLNETVKLLIFVECFSVPFDLAQQTRLKILLLNVVCESIRKF
jgi:hypothetical protein